MSYQAKSLGVRKEVEWTQLAAVDSARLVQGLTDLGLDPTPVIDEFKRVRRRERERVRRERRRLESRTDWGAGPPPPDSDWFDYWESAELERSLAQRLGDLLKGRTFRVEESLARSVWLPTFRLYAPGPKGSEATYYQKATEHVTGGWDVTVLGTGLGFDRTVTVEESGTITAVDGEAKLLSLPLAIQIHKIGVFEGGRQVGEGYRVEMAGQQTGKRNVKVKSELVEREAEPRPRLEDVTEIGWDLAKDTGKKSSTYSVLLAAYTKAKLTFGVEAFGAELRGTAEVTNNREVSIRAKLPGGRDYTMIWLTDPLGVAWRV